MLTDSCYSLGVEPIDSGNINSPPRHPKTQVVNKAMLLRVCLSAACIISGTLWVFKNEVCQLLRCSLFKFALFVTITNDTQMI